MHFTSFTNPKVNKSIPKSYQENEIYSSMIAPRIELTRIELIPFWRHVIDAALERKVPIIGIKLRASAASPPQM